MFEHRNIYKKTVHYSMKSKRYQPEKYTPWVTHVTRKSECHHRNKVAPPNGRDGLASRYGPAVQQVSDTPSPKHEGLSVFKFWTFEPMCSLLNIAYICKYFTRFINWLNNSIKTVLGHKQSLILYRKPNSFIVRNPKEKLCSVSYKT